jgi:hypothetical protein
MREVFNWDKNSHEDTEKEDHKQSDLYQQENRAVAAGGVHTLILDFAHVSNLLNASLLIDQTYPRPVNAFRVLDSRMSKTVP